jgi:hypothetical protein
MHIRARSNASLLYNHVLNAPHSVSGRQPERPEIFRMLGLAWLGLAWLGLAWLGLAPRYKQTYILIGAKCCPSCVNVTIIHVATLIAA